MKVNDRVTSQNGWRSASSGLVLAVEEFSEGTMYTGLPLEDYPLGIWFFNEAGHQDGIFVESRVILFSLTGRNHQSECVSAC